MKENSLDTEFYCFPSTRYQGSKRKLLPWIYEVIKNLEFETVLDVFGGSASVSYLLKRMNKTVTYNDIMKFNYYTGKALIENSKALLTNEDRVTLLNDGSFNSKIIQRNFKDVYFLDSENKWLDKVSNNILNMNHYVGSVLEYKRAIAYHSLFQASLIKRPFNLFHRKNLSLRTNDVERSFGNKTTWDHTFNKLFKQFIEETNSFVFDTNKRCRSINKSVFDIDEVGYDLVYLDPPYLSKDGSNETSNYFKCYHFLEGVANYEEWESMIDFDTINLRFKDDFVTNYFEPKKIHETFERIIEKFQDSIIVLSYKKGGMPSIDFLIKLMRKYKTVVYTKSQHYKYALNRQNDDTKKNREVLIIGM